MRTLYICRHAKSSWADPGQDDHDRPLNERGQRDAPLMANHFKERGERIDLIVSSDAVRALSTAKSFKQELRMDGNRFRLEPKLYHASVQTIAQVVAAFPDDCQRAMIVGHNPGLSEAVLYFSSENIGELPTCGLVRIDFVADEWKATGRDLGTLVWFEQPKRILGQG
ncbi:MAG: histidine phosphatase family protein [Flavobacteriales bacterium]|nr:histidine phosphatase family protein [Flavobacteriales bacterium]